MIMTYIRKRTTTSFWNLCHFSKHCNNSLLPKSNPMWCLVLCHLSFGGVFVFFVLFLFIHCIAIVNLIFDAAIEFVWFVWRDCWLNVCSHFNTLFHFKRFQFLFYKIIKNKWCLFVSRSLKSEYWTTNTINKILTDLMIRAHYLFFVL